MANASANDFSLTPLQIVSTTIITLSTSLSLLAYSLVLIILFLYFHEFKSNFYCLVISLAFADMGFLALVLFYMVPCNILQTDIWISTPYAAGLVEQLSYFTECTHLTYIALNRLIYASVSGTKHLFLDKIFNSRAAVCFWIVVLWVGGTVVPTFVQIAGCDLLYDYQYMALVFKCRNAISTSFTDQVMFSNEFVAGFLPSLITVLHLLAWSVVYFKGKKTSNNVNNEFVQQRKRERRILVQFTLISAALITYYGSFWAIPHFFGKDSPGLVLISFFGIASSAVNPFTYLAFNKLMKAKAKHLIFEVWLRRKNAVGDMGMTSNANGGKSQQRIN